MPVSIVVGGQFGSEGKGKVALEIARRDPDTVAAVRVGGTNSGHTAIDANGRTRVLRQLPAALSDRSIQAVLPPGSYIDLEVLFREVEELQLSPSNVLISPMARIITAEDKAWEASGQLNADIGSTESGTGASVLASIARGARNLGLVSVFAAEIPELKPFLADTSDVLRSYLKAGRRVIVEGTQGFGLSVLHGGVWPKATSRDTTAAGFLAEAGLSPLDVDDVTMVIRCHPIRVAGASGPLTEEIDWDTIAREAGLPLGFREYTTVTKRVRRVGRFDPKLVRRAICVNKPTRIVLNHLDYVDADIRSGFVSEKAWSFVKNVEKNIEQKVDWLGIGADRVIERSSRSLSEKEACDRKAPSPSLELVRKAIEQEPYRSH